VAGVQERGDRSTEKQRKRKIEGEKDSWSKGYGRREQ